jgi:hypothetical protein
VMPSDFLATANDIYGRTDAGTWSTYGNLSVQLMQGGATLYRAGKTIQIQKGQGVILRRLDILVPDEGAWGAMGPGGMVGHIPLVSRRAADLRFTHETVDQLIKAALGGDVRAVDELEKIIPLAWKLIDTALAEPENATKPGAPSLRMLRLLYDE